MLLQALYGGRDVVDVEHAAARCEDGRAGAWARGTEVDLEGAVEEEGGGACAGCDGVVEGEDGVPLDAGGSLEL